MPTPFSGFLNRGALFTTPGTGFVQAPLSVLASTFGNPAYETIFQAFSPVRLFSAIGSNITEVDFFVPGNPNMSATTTGFGAVFSDVDQPGASKKGKRGASSLIEYFGVDGELLFTSFIPASPGDGSPAEFREVIVLRELEGLSYKQIADVTQIPVGTVMSRLARGRKRLEQSLSQSPEQRERLKLEAEGSERDDCFQRYSAG